VPGATTVGQDEIGPAELQAGLLEGGGHLPELGQVAWEEVEQPLLDEHGKHHD
jgi:hypothetical protein